MIPRSPPRPPGHAARLAARIMVTGTWLALCVLLPLAAFAYATFVELRKQASLDPDARSTATFFLVFWLLGVFGSGTSLLWTTWGRAPWPVRLHAWCWVALLVPCCAPLALLGLGLATGQLHDDIAAMVVVSSSLGLLASVVLGWLLVLPLHLSLGALRRARPRSPPPGAVAP